MTEDLPDGLDYDDETDSDLESRIEELESRIKEVESQHNALDRRTISAAYSVGAALATVSEERPTGNRQWQWKVRAFREQTQITPCRRDGLAAD
jgi:hypothetical protein